MKPIWTENVYLPRFESLAGSVKTDVLIIGGGLAGRSEERRVGKECM